MPVNSGLADLSNDLLLTAVVIYALAMLAYACDFAFGKKAPAARNARVPALVGAQPAEAAVSQAALVGVKAAEAPVGQTAAAPGAGAGAPVSGVNVVKAR